MKKLKLMLVGLVLVSLSCSQSPGETVQVPLVDAGDDGRRGENVDVVVELVSEVDVPDAGDQLFFDFLADTGPDGLARTCALGEGCFLDPCDENELCQSGWCVQHLGDGLCSEACQEECPAGWSCQQVAGTVPDVVYICVSDFANLCRPCHTNDNCTSVGGASDACVDYGTGGHFCGGPCGEDEACPWGFTCKEIPTVEGTLLQQCVNDAGQCPCTQSSVSLGLTTACEVANEFGTCAGKRTCTVDGLSACDAAQPAVETCNGIDDDCDGEVDEPQLEGGKYVELCTDGNACTEDTCVGAEGCLNVILEAGECTDENPCTVADHCVAGVCMGDAVECDDGNPCTDNICTATGGCVYPPMVAPCDDGNPCTLADQCVDGICVGTGVECDCQQDADCAELEDGDLCNGVLYCDLSKLPYQCAVVPESVVSCPEPEGLDAICQAPLCDPGSGACSFVPAHQSGACEDGEPCTISDSCVDGVCAPGTPLNCNDGNPCTDDVCLPGVGCSYTHNGAPCSDGSACTVGDKCAIGECVPGESMACDDGNPCTGDSCSEAVGCVFLPMDGACDDGNSCTVGDHCQIGKCVAGSGADCNDGNVCTDDTCQPESGCLHALNSAPCDDGDICTTGDHCELGECGHSGELVCKDNNLCTADSCAPLVGCQFAPVDGGDCTDMNLCTAGDKCVGGFCQPGAAIKCDDQNFCTDDSCEPGAGCVNANNSAPCDDGDVCSVLDACENGSCQPGNQIGCDDGNVCTDDWCDANSGCQHSPTPGLCNDGNACTTADSCVDGECAGGPVLVCNDENVCTDDKCDENAGCQYTANSAACEDGNACTVSDQCQGGKCSPGGAKNCNDDIECTDDSCDPQSGCQHTPGQNCCAPSGQRLPFNSLVDGGQASCFASGNPCPYDVAYWSTSHIRGFAAFGEYVTCGGTTGCAAHVGIGTYGGGGNVCHGKWDVYCDGEFQCSINILGKVCTGTAMTNGCQCDFPGPRICSTIKLVAAQDGNNTAACCGGSQPDSAIDAISVW